MTSKFPPIDPFAQEEPHLTASNDPSSALKTRLRTRTNTAEIDDTIIHPGSVKINVQGAFIVDEKNSNAHGAPPSPNGGSHDTNDIRLPNHTAVVSHIAVDVSKSFSLKFLPFLRISF